MKVSMVLPVHNGAAYLPAAIESVLTQSFHDFELICVDDGSSDESPRILARYAANDPRIRIITLSPNVGLPAALNRGFAAARGAYHSWTSDDNMLDPAMLETLVAALDAHPDIGVVHADYDVIDETGAFVRHVAVGPYEQLIYGNNIGACFLYRADVTAQTGGYDEGIMGAEDYDFWLRAAHQFRFLALPQTLYAYRRHGGSLTAQRSRRNVALRDQILLRELDSGFWTEDKSERAAILRTMVYTNPWQPRFDLLAKSAAAAPLAFIASILEMARWVYYSLRQHLRG